MADWNYQFDPVHKAEWLQQIEKDLKGKPLSSIEGEWWPGEPLIPYAHAEDAEPVAVRLPDHIFAEPPLIVEWIDTVDADPQAINAHILDTLEFGAQVLVLDLPGVEPSIHNGWFEGVHTEMIGIEFALNTSDVAKLTNSTNPSPANARLRVPHELIDSAKPAPQQLKRVYSIPGEGIWDQVCGEKFSSLRHDLGEWKKRGGAAVEFLSQVLFVFEPGPDFYKSLIQHRVLHLLFQNIYLAETGNTIPTSHHYLETRIQLHEAEDADAFLIRASSSTLAACLGGAQRICIDHKISRMYQRVGRNIHHLLQMESHMTRSTDPLAGSYSIDLYTRRWTEMIWNRAGE